MLNGLLVCFGCEQAWSTKHNKQTKSSSMAADVKRLKIFLIGSVHLDSDARCIVLSSRMCSVIPAVVVCLPPALQW